MNEQDRPLYVGLISQAGFCGTHPDDTMSSHVGWCEETEYEEEHRPELPLAGPVMFNLNANEPQTIVALFVTTDRTKGGTCGEMHERKYFLEDRDREAWPGKTFCIGAEFLRAKLEIGEPCPNS